MTERESAVETSVTGYGRVIADIQRPQTLDDVVTLVRSARLTRKPLYPISRGLNWGYGSRTPPVDGCTLVDLSAMNRIRNAQDISLENPIAVIEPGVTQGQLYEHLQRHCPNLSFNVTGAGSDTSILGNALDRGFGYLGPRSEDTFGLEVVCGTGEVLRTGFRRLGETSPLAHSHPAGLGPAADGLFFQGNFGIVTSACFRLVPRAEKQIAVLLALHDETHLAALVDVLARLKQEGVLTAVTHVGNRARLDATLMRGIVRYLEQRFSPERARAEASSAIAAIAPHLWSSITSVSGSPRRVAAIVAETRARMRGIARLTVVSDASLRRRFALLDRLRFIPAARIRAAALSAIQPLHALAMGTPSDLAIDNLLWLFDSEGRPAVELDQTNCGILFICPALPLRGRLVAEILADMKAVATEHGHTLYVTANVETTSSMTAIANLIFDRSRPEDVERAHRCADALLSYIHRNNLEVYRARSDMMQAITERTPEHWRLMRSLKTALDPENIIAPGRYSEHV